MDHFKLNFSVLSRNSQASLNWKLGRIVQLHPVTDGIVNSK